ncbi:MAG: hypothetical protein WCW14_05110 [Candidatus Paceibacterota bacterium]|jgi:hypothetical protein
MSGEPRNSDDEVEMGSAPWNEVLSTIEEVKKMGRITRGGMRRFRKAHPIEKLSVALTIEKGTQWTTRSFGWSGEEMVARLKSKKINLSPELERITINQELGYYQPTKQVFRYGTWFPSNGKPFDCDGMGSLFDINTLAREERLKQMTLEAALLFRDKFSVDDLHGFNCRAMCRLVSGETFSVLVGGSARGEFVSTNPSASDFEKVSGEDLFLFLVA